MSLPLYRSDWNPPGYRKSWERCPMDTKSSGKLLGAWHDRIGSEMTEAVAWLNENGALRILVADYANGRRLIMRAARGGWSLTSMRQPPAKSRPTQPQQGEGERG